MNPYYDPTTGNWYDQVSGQLIAQGDPQNPDAALDMVAEQMVEAQRRQVVNSLMNRAVQGGGVGAGVGATGGGAAAAAPAFPVGSSIGGGTMMSSGAVLPQTPGFAGSAAGVGPVASVALPAALLAATYYGAPKIAPKVGDKLDSMISGDANRRFNLDELVQAPPKDRALGLENNIPGFYGLDDSRKRAFLQSARDAGMLALPGQEGDRAAEYLTFPTQQRDGDQGFGGAKPGKFFERRVPDAGSLPYNLTPERRAAINDIIAQITALRGANAVQQAPTFQNLQPASGTPTNITPMRR